jgi:hypothetical protein
MRKLGVVSALLGLLFLLPSDALAQVKGVYWTSSGMFGPFNMQGLVPSLPKEKARGDVRQHVGHRPFVIFAPATTPPSPTASANPLGGGAV